MRLTPTARIKGEGAIAFLVIVLLIVGGLGWWLYSSRMTGDKNIRVFALQVITRMTVNYDDKFLRNHLSLEGQKQMMRSWQDRMFEQFRSVGVPAQPIVLEGSPEFERYFFDPHGIFRAHLTYPTTTADVEIGVSRSMTAWQVDSVNVTWPPQPTPTPGPTPEATVTPTPAPEKAKHKTR